MNSEVTVRNWQKAIIADAAAKLERPLRDYEREFITSRSGFIALEMIHDTVRTSEQEDLTRYLGSEKSN